MEEIKYNRMKKNTFLISLMFIIIILSTKLVVANFVCGQVLDADDNMSAQWYSVMIYYPSSQNNYAGCEISPAENKYCCDTEAIPRKTWKIGDIVGAEVFDSASGYVAGPVSIVTSGEGYDVLPVMQLERVIKVRDWKKLIFSNETGFLLNASFREPYNFVELERNNDKSVLCENCSNFSEYINVSFGMNYLRLIASDVRSISEDLVVVVLNWFKFERKIECKGCLGNRVRHNQVVDVALLLNLSHYVEGLELKEYVPIDFEILETDGQIRAYSQTHNMIVWNVSGKNIEKKYVIKSPKIRFFPKKYSFRTELEDKIMSEEDIIVFRFFWFFPFNQKGAQNYFDPHKMQTRIYPNRPLVKRFDNEIIRVAVFPKKTIRNAEFDLLNYTLEDLDDFEVISSYLFDTNFAERTEKIYIEFKVEKNVSEIYESISLFVLNQDWKENEIKFYEEDEIYLYYKASFNGKGIAIVGKKKGFFELLIGGFS